MESRVRVPPHGNDYDFICTCITGSIKFPKSLTPSRYYWLTRLTLGSTIFARKSHLSVVSRVN